MIADYWQLTTDNMPFRRESIANTFRGRSPGLSVVVRLLRSSKTSNGLLHTGYNTLTTYYCLGLYSCATAHDLHVIPSWQPDYGADPDGVFSFQSAVALMDKR